MSRKIRMHFKVSDVLGATLCRRTPFQFAVRRSPDPAAVTCLECLAAIALRQTVPPWGGPSRYRGYTISAPWQSRVGGMFSAQVLLTHAQVARIAGETPELCYEAGVRFIDGALAALKG